MSTKSTIEADEARQGVGKAIYGDDWIGSLNKREKQLLWGPNGITEKTLENGLKIRVVARCDKPLRQRLDAVIGRAERWWAQYSVAIDLLHDRGFRDGTKQFDRAAVEHLISSLAAVPKAEKRGAGKPPVARESCKHQMRADHHAGIDVFQMKETAMAERYGVARRTAVDARNELREELSRINL
jgi:hypothetical protein